MVFSVYQQSRISSESRIKNVKTREKVMGKYHSKGIMLHFNFKSYLH